MSSTPDLPASLDAVTHAEQSAHRLASLVAERQQAYDDVLQTKTFRYVALLRRVYVHLRRLARRARPGPPSAAVHRMADTPIPDVARTYTLWTQLFETFDDAQIQRRVDALAHQPLVSVVFAPGAMAEDEVRTSIDSVTAQLYLNWELLVAVGAAATPGVRTTVARRATHDKRITVVEVDAEGAPAALTRTVERASGEWIAFLDDNGRLARHALALAMVAGAHAPDAALLYSDEDMVGTDRRRHSPDFKPEFDPLLLEGQNYVRHFLLVRRGLVETVGNLRDSGWGRFDWDLARRVTDIIAPEQVVHIPHVLYHSGGDAPTSSGPARADIASKERGRPQDDSGHLPLVSIVIPTRDGDLLARCLHSVLDSTRYPNFEIVVIDNGSTGEATSETLRSLADKIVVIRDERPFKYSALNNAAVRHTTGDAICLLNDDTEVVTPEWLDKMVGHLQGPGVGAVGAKLLYGDGRIQHAGIVLGIGGVAGHPGKRTDGSSPGFAGRLDLAHTVSAVTGACMLVRREAWDAVGGLEEEHLAIAFNDVDFCLRLGDAGWRVVWTPEAVLMHHESVSRGSEDHRIEAFTAEHQFMQQRWGMKLRTDPHYSPNLSLATEDGSLAWPPRILWEQI